MSIVPIDSVNNSVKLNFSANMMVGFLLCAFRHDNLKFFSSRSVEYEIDNLVWEVFEGRIKAEIVMSCQTVHHPTIPTIWVVIKGLLDKCSFYDAASSIRHKQIGMNLEVRS